MSAALTIGAKAMDMETFAQKLRDPFPESDIEWRVQASGSAQNKGAWVRVLAYITNRAIMERLDAVCGLDGWRNEFMHTTNAVLCGISIRVNGEWLTKWDGASQTDIEPAKGGISSAMKRAAVQWGIGRYLYNLEEGYATIAPITDRDAPYYLKANNEKHGPALRWYPPRLRPWALPGGSGDPGVVRSVPTPKAVPAAPPAESGGHNRITLPGTKSVLGGHGGKRIGDVPTDALHQIREYLLEKGGYTDVVDAIDMALDERTQGGGA